MNTPFILLLKPVNFTRFVGTYLAKNFDIPLKIMLYFCQECERETRKKSLCVAGRMERKQFGARIFNLRKLLQSNIA